MNVMGSFPETEIFMEKQPEPDLGLEFDESVLNIKLNEKGALKLEH